MKKGFLLLLFAAVLSGMTSVANAQSTSQRQGTNGQRSGRGGAMVDKSGDAELQALIAETVDKFKVLTYVDEETKDTMTYNFFIPDNYDSNK